MKKCIRRIYRAFVLFWRWFHYYCFSASFSQSRADFKIWIKTTLGNTEMVAEDLPWLVLPAVRWLSSKINPDMSVFEWGSGGSTTFFANKVRSVISIEFDHLWLNKVKARLSEQGKDNVRFILVGTDELNSALFLGQNQKCLYEAENRELFGDKLFYRYVNSINNYPDEYFDLILVDGEARKGCLTFSKNKVKRGGMIVLDDTECQLYQEPMKEFKSLEWQRVDFFGPAPSCIWPAFRRTTVFIKKGGEG